MCERFFYQTKKKTKLSTFSVNRNILLIRSTEFHSINKIRKNPIRREKNDFEMIFFSFFIGAANRFDFMHSNSYTYILILLQTDIGLRGSPFTIWPMQPT